jgi:hypothetical protein
MPIGIIDELKSTITGTKGVARPNKFKVLIYPPAGFKNSINPFPRAQDITKRLSLSCEISSIPSRATTTAETVYYGLQKKFAYAYTFGDVEMTFRVHNDMMERNFFEAWQEMLVDPKTLNANYRKEYVANIEIEQLSSENNKPLVSYLLIDAFPISIGELALDYSADGYHRLSVTFAYHKWRTEIYDSLGMKVERWNTSRKIEEHSIL